MSRMPSDQVTLGLSTKHALRGEELDWNDTSVTKVILGLSLVGIAVLGLMFLNNAYGFGSFLAQHTLKSWPVGSACQIDLVEGKPNLKQARSVQFRCDQLNQGLVNEDRGTACLIWDRACSVDQIASAKLTYLKWDESRVLIAASASHLEREVRAIPGNLRILQTASFAVGDLVSTKKHLHDASRTWELWIANFLLAILLGLGLLAVFDGALLVPAEKARLRAMNQVGI